MPSIKVDPTRRGGSVDPLIYGHFTEHLANIMYDGLWSELLFGRKFETPMTGRRAEICAPWEPFGGHESDTTYLRGPDATPRFASPQDHAHHAQGVKATAGHAGRERGLAQRDIPLDAGTTYLFRGSVRRVGPAGTLRVALRSADGRAVLAEASIDVPEVTTTRFGEDFPHNTLWMDDMSWREVGAELTVEADEPAGVFTATFETCDDSESLWMFDWVSLMPADHQLGWHGEVVRALRDLPVRSLKWPGGCMADDYDWRYGIGPADTRFGTVDQAWATWDENDVGIDEFMELCRLTSCEPILGLNGGNGTPEMAAEMVEYCNGSVDSVMGARRAANGHPEPYGIKFWVIGNEQWGFFETGYVGPEQYADRYIEIARAVRKADPSVNITAVGHVGDFNRIVLEKAAAEMDMLQIHLYTPDAGPSVTDPESAMRKIRSAQIFDVLLAKIAEDIAAVDGADHIRLNVDEWGWGHAGHTGAIFMAGALNAFHRAAPLVQLASKAAVINVDGVLERVGQNVTETSAYDVFSLFNEGHRSATVDIEIAGDDADRLDISALGDDQGVSIFVVNRAPMPTALTLSVDGSAPADIVQIATVLAESDDLTGASTVVRDEKSLGEITEVAPLSLTLLQIGR